MRIDYYKLQELFNTYRLDKDTDLINPDFVRRFYSILRDFDIDFECDVRIQDDCLFVDKLILKSECQTNLNLIGRLLKFFYPHIVVEYLDGSIIVKDTM